MSKHTPGTLRWTESKNTLYSDEGHGFTEILNASDDGKPYGMALPTIKHHWRDETAEANRKLIAAAPNLLESLRGLLSALDEDCRDTMRWDDLMFNARAAIAKATGEKA